MSFCFSICWPIYFVSLPHRPHQFLLVCVTRGKGQGAWQKRYNSFLLSQARDLAISTRAAHIPFPFRVSLPYTLAPSFLTYNVWFRMIFVLVLMAKEENFLTASVLIIEKAWFQARTAATVWNWSGKCWVWGPQFLRVLVFGILLIF